MQFIIAVLCSSLTKMGPHRPFLVGSSSGTIHDNDGAAHPNLPSTQPRLQLQNPDDNDLFKLLTFAKKDEEEINSTTTFGLRAGRERSRRRIVGGKSASPGSYKFMALVYFVDTAGNHTYQLSPPPPSFVYLYCLEINKYTSVKKVEHASLQPTYHTRSMLGICSSACAHRHSNNPSVANCNS